MTPPSPDILAYFGVRLTAPLGGRLNQHWRVEARQEPLVLRRWGRSGQIDWSSIHYEVDLMTRIASLGWPVAAVVAGPVELEGYAWSLAPFLPGEVVAAHGSAAEQRARGRLLAEFHLSLASLPALEQRSGWRRCEVVLADPALDTILSENEQRHPEEVRIYRRHLEHARERIAGLSLRNRPGGIVHGDFTPWNLRFTDNRLSGILDFELAHSDHRIGDFALSWRGLYDEVIHGYAEVSPLEPEEWALITPLWWAHLLEAACRDLQSGIIDDGWTVKKLLLRSPLMGPDAAEYRQR